MTHDRLPVQIGARTASCYAFAITMLSLDLSSLPPRLHVGTSSFSSTDWSGVFYPLDLAPADFLSFYATQLPTVEIDSSWYGTPSRRTVDEWARKTPPGFIFSLKVPRAITHDKELVGCEDDWTRFLQITDALGEKRGPLIFQFPYVAKGKDAEEYRTGREFLCRLESFLPLIPEDVRTAVEVRNEKWLAAPLLDLLRWRGIALVLPHYYTMPGPEAYLEKLDPITADFTVIRFLGNHKEIDVLVAQARAAGRRSRDWESPIIDRTADIRRWMPVFEKILGYGNEVFSYMNNHFSGFAPDAIDLLTELWRERARQQRL